MRITTALIAAAIAVSGTVEAGEEERKISLSDLPPDVKAAADKAVPGAKWHSAEQETGKGGVHYELKGKGIENDREVEVEVMPDGKLLQTEIEVPMKEVPEPVRAAFKERWPDSKPKEVKAVTRQNGASGYEFEEARGLGKEFEVFISGDGKTVEVKED
ncbi:PepSY domain-containing protein [Methylomagnum sp.]